MNDNSSRGQFSSSWGFVMAAAGSAIGLGNIWGFPTQAAQNGGAGFVLMYILLSFLVGYPLLMAEFTIGRYTQSNPVGAYQKMEGGKPFIAAGFLGILTVSFVLSFYCIVAGKMLAFFVNAFFDLWKLTSVAQWVISGSLVSDLLFTTLFFLFTLWIISAGVKNGIEKWTKRLMPALVIMMIFMVIYVLTLEGAMDGVRAYLVPDFTKALKPKLLLNAMGQAFFSLSLGAGGMLVLASYTSKKENLVRMGLLVTVADLCIAFLAGLLILPAMYVALEQGTPIYDEGGKLLSGGNLIFQVLPELFKSLGIWGLVLAMVFFLLMTFAALTSSISMMEVPTSYLVDNQKMKRKKAAWLVGMVFWVVSVVITLNSGWLFQLMVDATTKYSQPLLGFVVCIFVGWVVRRDTVIRELSQGHPEIRSTVFMRIWPFFLKYVSPVLILLVFLQSFIN